MKKTSKTISVLFSLLIGQTICIPVFAESRTADQKAKDISVYSTEINGSNAVKANAENEEFLFGESEVVYDFDKAVRIYTDISSLTDPVSLKEDATTKEFLVPVKDKNGSFISYAEFVTDDEGYKLVSVSQGDYYTELYNTLECDNFNTYVKNSDGVYVYSDPLLNDIGFYVEKSDFSSEFLDYTALYNNEKHITDNPISTDMVAKCKDMSAHTGNSKTNETPYTAADLPANSLSSSDMHSRSETISKDEFINSVNLDYMDEELNQILSDEEITPAIITRSFWITLNPGDSYTDLDGFTLMAGDGTFFNVTISGENSLSSGETVRLGLKNTSTNMFYYKPVANLGTNSYYRAIDNNGSYKFRVANETSQTLSISVTYYILYYHNGTDVYSENINLIAQKKDKWCWAACIQMVASFFGYNKTQSQIVLNTHGNTEDLGGNPNDYPVGTQYATNNQYTALYVNFIYSPAQLRNGLLMNEGTLLILQYLSNETNTTKSHAVVLTGVDSSLNFVRVNDPMKPKGSVKVFDYYYLINTNKDPHDLTYNNSVIFLVNNAV